MKSLYSRGKFCHTNFMAKVPQSLTTVTLFSKILATIILVMIIPMASFYAGMQYQKAATIGDFELPTAVTYGERMRSITRETMRNYLSTFIPSTTLSAKRLEDYKVYLPETVVEKDGQLSFQMTISVKPASKQANAFWLSGNGILESDGWVTGKKMDVKAVKKNGLYQVTSLTPVK